MRSLIGIFIATTALWTTPSPAASITQDPYFEYDLRFTNPVCRAQNYHQEVYSRAGDLLEGKPVNTFCSYSDARASGIRPSSPQSKLLEWIADPATEEIFLAYLSFSNNKIKTALCNAIEQRSVKVTMVLHRETNLSRANSVLNCQPANQQESHRPQLVLRGANRGVKYAHNKLLFINPDAPDKVHIAFSSGNLSAGVVLHHENWNFITVSSPSYFAEAHRCLRTGVLDPGRNGKGLGRAKYRDFIRNCKARIAAPEETDIKTYFVPGEGQQATAVISDKVATAHSIAIAAHRFSYPKLMDILQSKMRGQPSTQMRLVLDDDIYWAGEHNLDVGPNLPWEYAHVRRLVNLNAQVKFMETNHQERLLHHNKFLIFQSSTEPASVFTGAGNLTGTAFKDNFENFYWIQIPAVVEGYLDQYQHLWHELATGPDQMPQHNILPR